MRIKSRVSLDKVDGGNFYIGNKQKEFIVDRQENRNILDIERDLLDIILLMEQVFF